MNNKQGNFLLGLLAGAATGVIVGMLYAPDKGVNTRERLSYLLSKYKKQLETLLTEMKDGKDETPNEAKEESQKITNETKEKAQKLFDDVENLIEQIKHKNN
jgi:gas vesicle protein